MCPIIAIICPSLPHSLHILALDLFIIFSLKAIMDFTFLSSSSRSNEPVRARVVSVAGLLLVSLFDLGVNVFCSAVGKKTAGLAFILCWSTL